MKKRTFIISTLLFAPLALSGHGDGGHEHSHAHEEGAHEHDDHEEGIVPWSTEKTEAAKIHIETAAPGKLQNYIQVPGKVEIHPDYLVYIIPKVNGVATAVLKNIGDPVRKDEVLAVLESREMAEAKAGYLAARRKLQLKRLNLKREEELQGISAGQDYTNAQAESQEAEINVDLAKQTLYALGLSQKEIEDIAFEDPAKLRFYAIKSPIKGKVLKRNITLGELVSNTNRIYTIADFEKVWIEMSLSQNDLPYLKEGLPTEILGADGKKATVHLCQFNPAINEETRKATAMAVLENSADKWTPGEFVSVKIQTEVSDAAVLIPKNAIQSIKGEDTVFVPHGDDFLLVPVTIGKTDDTNAEILSGLNPGDLFAAGNTFLIKAEYEKEEAEHSH